MIAPERAIQQKECYEACKDLHFSKHLNSEVVMIKDCWDATTNAYYILVTLETSQEGMHHQLPKQFRQWRVEYDYGPYPIID